METTTETDLSEDDTDDTDGKQGHDSPQCHQGTTTWYVRNSYGRRGVLAPLLRSTGTPPEIRRGSISGHLEDWVLA